MAAGFVVSKSALTIEQVVEITGIVNGGQIDSRSVDEMEAISAEASPRLWLGRHCLAGYKKREGWMVRMEDRYVEKRLWFVMNWMHIWVVMYALLQRGLIRNLSVSVTRVLGHFMSLQRWLWLWLWLVLVPCNNRRVMCLIAFREHDDGTE